VSRRSEGSRLGRMVRIALLGLVGLGFALPVTAQPGRPDQEPLVLDEARKAEFTATEGTWISLDVSPDGAMIVFDLLGDIWTMPVEGGDATRITEGLAFDAQPRFSPDGQTIAFISDRSGGDNLWTMRLDFTDTTQVSRGNGNLYLSPEWMPDGEHIVVSRSGGLGGAAKLFMFNAEKPAPMPLVATPASGKFVGAAPSPDGRYVWFARSNGDWNYNARFPLYALARYDRETGQTLGMTSRYGGAFRPAISPDGQWLVYGTRYNTETGLRKRDLATGREEWLAYPVQRDEQESRAPLDVLPGYAFTPDSEAVVASYGGKIWRIPMDGSDAVEIPFSADVELAIGPEVKFDYAVDTASVVTAGQIRHPQESPDGTMLVFEALDRLWIKDLPDGEPRRLTRSDVGEHHATWSPDGSAVAYSTWDDEAGGHIMRVPVGAVSQPQQLTTDAALYYNLAWAPDGERIVASRAAARQLKRAPDVFFGPQGGEFVWVSATGGDANLISPMGGLDVMHFNLNEPERIYAYGFGAGLVSFRWDGTDRKQHLQVRGAPARPTNAIVHQEEYVQLPRRVFPTSAEQFYGPMELDGGQLGAGPPPPGGGAAGLPRPSSCPS